MKYFLTALIAAVALMFVAAPATADWDPGDDFKMHFPQLPDLENGMNVLASTIWGAAGEPPRQKVLADDFECTQTGPITDIHIWGSWLDNIFPWGNATSGTTFQDPGNVAFKLSIHDDIPKDDNNPYSRPVLPALWETIVMPSQVRFWANSTERFFDPNFNEVIGFDTQVYQYNFFFDEAEAFWQQGTKERPITYWLNVTAMPFDDLATFGWKTSRDHWNDDAVYWDEGPFGATTPLELFDPFTGESLDMAFVITPEPGTVVMLLGAGLMGLAVYARRRRKS